jgi:hypothetical protein
MGKPWKLAGRRCPPRQAVWLERCPPPRRRQPPATFRHATALPACACCSADYRHATPVALKYVKRGYHVLCSHGLTLLLVPLAAMGVVSRRRRRCPWRCQPQALIGTAASGGCLAAAVHPWCFRWQEFPSTSRDAFTVPSCSCPRPLRLPALPTCSWSWRRCLGMATCRTCGRWRARPTSHSTWCVWQAGKQAGRQAARAG